MAPTSNHGKICYLQIPAIDAEASARFYHEVFGWPLRSHDDGTPAFDDSTGQVSGMWVTGRTPWAGEPGLLVDIMVDDAEETVASIVAHGGEIVRPIGWEAPELTAAFRDPAGNILGIYQGRPSERRAHRLPARRGQLPADPGAGRRPAGWLLPARVRLGHPR